MFDYKDEADALLRKVPVYLEAPDGSPYTGSLSGFTITWRRPDAVGGNVDKTAIFAQASGGLYFMSLVAGDVDVAGVGFVTIEKEGTIQRWADPVLIRTMPLKIVESTYVAGSAGDNIRRGALAGGHEFSMIDNTVYGANALLTLARERIFASAAALASAVAGHSDNADGEIYRYTISSVDAGSGEFTSWKKTRTL